MGANSSAELSQFTAASAPTTFNLLWLQSGGCGGCTMSLLCADTSDFFGSLTDAGINLLWHPLLSNISAPERKRLLDSLTEYDGAPSKYCRAAEACHPLFRGGWAAAAVNAALARPGAAAGCLLSPPPPPPTDDLRDDDFDDD